MASCLKRTGALKAALNTTHTILDAMPLGVAIVGADNKIRRINQVALEMMGLEAFEGVRLG